MNVIILFEIMNIWFQHVVTNHCFPQLARIALKVIVSEAIVNRNTLITEIKFFSKTSTQKCEDKAINLADSEIVK